jgi:putative ABC transport system permease protein
VLFLFLGLPGAILAVVIAATIASAGNDRRRAEQALLRARGATTTALVRMATAEALAVGVVASVAGVVVGSIIGTVVVGNGSLGATLRSTITWGLAAALAGIAIALATIAVPAWRDARRLTVNQARRRLPGVVRRRSRMLAALVLLGVSAFVFAKTSSDGYNLVLVAEGVPAISVSYWAFLGPALFWVGAGLLVWELAALALEHGRRVGATLMRPFAGTLAPTVAASMQRQRSRLAKGLVVVCLTVAFAVSTAAFNETYRQQATVDALLSNGADVTVTSSGTAGVATDLTSAIAATPGVGHVEPLQHRYAYVGADLQDLFGVRPSTVVDATKLQDAYFAGGSARDLIAKLGSSTDGLLVSAETVKDFQLQPGDAITLRLQAKAGGAPVPVTFHYVGVAKEFPTAPKDSFLVANADYIASATGSAATDTYLVSTNGASPAGVADQIRAQTSGTAVVTDIGSTRKVVGSSLTAVDLAGLTSIELAFAGVLVVAATGLVLVLGVAERRRTFAITTALGANRRQIGSFVWSEAMYVTVGGLAIGALIGWALTRMLIAVLTGVFDPAPEHAAVPWTYLGLVLAAAIGAVIAASALAIRLARSTPLAALRAS